MTETTTSTTSSPVDYSGAVTTRQEPDEAPAAVFAGYLKHPPTLPGEDVYDKALRRIQGRLKMPTIDADTAIEFAAPDDQ